MTPDEPVLQRRAASASIWQLYIALLTTLCAAISGAYIFFRAACDDLISKRLEPYERLLYGTELNNDGRYDEAVTEFEHGFDALIASNSASGASPRLAIYLNRYLVALSECERPAEHRAQFNRCRQLFARDLVTETPSHKRSAGWFLLRVGEHDQARIQFEQALKQSLQFDDTVSQAWAHYGLSYSSLCTGDWEAAWAHSEEGLRKAPSESFYYDPDYSTNKKLSALYPTFSPALTKFGERLGEKKAKTDPNEQLWAAVTDLQTRTKHISTSAGRTRIDAGSYHLAIQDSGSVELHDGKCNVVWKLPPATKNR